MHGDTVVAHQVPSFIKVNLAGGQPRAGVGPKGGPGAAGLHGQVGKLGNHEAAIVGGLAGDTDTVTAFSSRIVGVVGVGANVDLAVGGGDEAEALGVSLASVLDITMCGIPRVAVGVRAGEKVKLVKEVVGRVLFCELVGLGGCVDSCGICGSSHADFFEARC